MPPILDPAQSAGGQSAGTPPAILNADGTFSPNWHTNPLFGEDFKDNQTLANTKDIKALVSQVVNSEKLIGKRVEEIIPKNATPEQQLAFARKYLGAPDKIEGYADIVKPKDWPENIPWDDNRLNDFKKLAAESGLLPHQAKAGFEMYNKLVLASYKAAEDAESQITAEAEKQLKEQFKNEYPKVVERANNVLAKFGGTVGEDVARKYGSDPILVTLLNNIGMAMSEDTIRTPGGQQVSLVAEAQAKIDKIRADKEHPFFDKQKPSHDAAVKEMQKLYEIIYPPSNG